MRLTCHCGVKQTQVDLSHPYLSYIRATLIGRRGSLPIETHTKRGASGGLLLTPCRGAYPLWVCAGAFTSTKQASAAEHAEEIENAFVEAVTHTLVHAVVLNMFQITWVIIVVK